MTTSKAFDLLKRQIAQRPKEHTPRVERPAINRVLMDHETAIRSNGDLQSKLRIAEEKVIALTEVLKDQEATVKALNEVLKEREATVKVLTEVLKEQEAIVKGLNARLALLES